MDASQHFDEFAQVVYDCVRDLTDEMAKIELRPLRKKMCGLKRLMEAQALNVWTDIFFIYIYFKYFPHIFPSSVSLASLLCL